MKHQTGRGVAKRFAAAIGAVALAAVSMTALAGSASAAPANVPTAPGTLTIHKFEQPSPAGGENNSGGTITVPAGWVALAGVNFQLQQITDVDLTTTEGWELVDGYVTDPASATALGTASTVTTGADGTVATANLPIGAYLVTELPSPGATKAGTTDPANITMMAAPFVVTLPIPDGDGTWNSDVHVYPKNSVTAVEKSVGAPSGNGIGSTLPWTITVQIPTLTQGETFQDFDITDALDPKLAYVAGSATATSGGTAVTFADNTVGQNVEISITDLAALTAAQGQTLTVAFTTTVIAAGEIVNEADVFVNDPGHSNGIGSNPATSYWGQIRIIKHAQGDETATLADAVFTVHATLADATTGDNPITVDGETEFRTLADGTVVIPGLFVSNTAGQTRDYFLREIAAPAGYMLVPTPITVTLTANAGVVTPIEIKVPNPQNPSFELPLTGAAGTVLMSVIGGALLIGGSALALIAGRRRKATQV